MESFGPNHILVILLSILFLSEIHVSRRKQKPVGSKLFHYLHNLPFQLMAIGIGSLIVVVIASTFQWIDGNDFGLFNWISMPFWLKVTLGVPLLDLADYWLHRFNHSVPLLWRQHRVHHSDTTMDASTALRHYPTELVYFTAGQMILAVGIGLPVESMNIYILLLLPMFLLQHTDLNFPKWTDRVLGPLFATPNYHKVHHDQDVRYTDSNFSSVFIVWDRLFGTFRLKSVDRIRYGLSEFDTKKRQSFWFQLKSPFLDIKEVPLHEPPEFVDRNQEQERSSINLTTPLPANTDHSERL